MKTFKKRNSYTYDEIESLSLDKDFDDGKFSLKEEGRFQIGQQFLILEHKEKDIVASFVLTGTMGENSIYECIYTDFE